MGWDATLSFAWKVQFAGLWLVLVQRGDLCLLGAFVVMLCMIRACDWELVLAMAICFLMRYSFVLVTKSPKRRCALWCCGCEYGHGCGPRALRRMELDQEISFDQ